MAKIAVAFDQAKQRAHTAALTSALCRGLFDRWKAELLLAAHGKDEATRA
jgi:hypothetical protein